MRKPAFYICENKDADQLRGDREADQRLCFRYTQGRTQRCCCRGGGAPEAEVLNRAAKAASREGEGESMKGGLNLLSLGGPGASPGKFCKIYVAENEFQAILKPIFQYSITSNTLFLLLTFHFLVILLVLWYGCAILLWHSLGLPNYFLLKFSMIAALLKNLRCYLLDSADD